MSDLNQTLIDMKQSYIEYALFHYHFKSRISVWILNYLKSSSNKLKQIHFVNEKISNHQTLEIGLRGSNASAIKLVKNNHILMNTNEIFKYITAYDGTIDILIHFDSQDAVDVRLNDLIIQQLMYSSQYAAYLGNIYHLSIDSYKAHTLIEQLQQNIDLSLQMKDQEQFYQLSQILNVFQAR